MSDYKIIDLDECVIDALNLFIKKGLPKLNLGNFKRPLVLGSGNAVITGRILFEDKDAIFADESSYKSKLENNSLIDGVVLISASGEKHAPIIAEEVKKKKIPMVLLTCNSSASAKKFIDNDKFFVYPKNPEPFSYNTSTYLGMIISKTREDPKKILDFIKKEIDPKVPKDLFKYDSYYFLIPENFNECRQMIHTKFDELFSSKINGRIYTNEQTKHAKTIVPSDKELFVSFGVENKIWGKNRLSLSLPKNSGSAAMIAIGYYFVGKIQKQNPQWFKDNIEEYCKNISKVFGSEIKVIVE